MPRLQAPASSGKPQQRKGGLSMFLSGGLEAAAQQAPPSAPTTPAAAPRRTHSWATAGAAAEVAAKPAPVSLLDIQQAEAAAAAATRAPAATSLLSGALKAKRQQSSGSPANPVSDWETGAPSRAGNEAAGPSNVPTSTAERATGGGSRIPLAQFILPSPSTPIAVVGGPVVEAAPAWGGASGASPPGSTARPSLRQIQARGAAYRPPHTDVSYLDATCARFECTTHGCSLLLPS